ncbi:MAG: GHKL domain-containing protein [Lachnospiraceae bacterium]
MLLIIHTTLLFIYAVTIMTLLLDVSPSSLSLHKKILFGVGTLFLLFLNNVLVSSMDLDQYGIFYPLFIQLPVFLLFCIISRRSIIKVLFVLLTTIFLCFPFSILTIFSGQLFSSIIWQIFSSLVIFAALILCVKQFIKNDFDYVMDYFNSIDILKFCTIPISYNILNYALGHYSAMLPLVFMRGLIFLSAFAAYSLTMNIFHRTKDIQQLQQEQLLMESRIASANEQLTVLHASHEQAAVYRHDMRHHLALIQGYLTQGEVSRALSYIGNAQSDIESMTPAHYCPNIPINLIFIFFVAKAQKQGVTLNIITNIPKVLPIHETELCSILSNGLENAITAASKITQKERIVYVNCHVQNDTFLICIKNMYEGCLTLKHTLPSYNEKEHGFGLRSIQMLAEKNNGHCSFTAENQVFTLTITLPVPYLFK